MTMLHTLSSADLYAFFCSAEATLDQNKEEVNALNVFPVPDGDTGTNMSLTMRSAVANLSANMSITELCTAVSRGALMGARGNSGVILSQILRGFCTALQSAAVIDSVAVAQALNKGVEIAYKSVLKPVEGTILTVSRLTARAAMEQAPQEDDIVALVAYALEQGRIALDNTPNQLPVLKEAGVVDSGGRGFILLIEGGLAALSGSAIDSSARFAAKPVAKAQPDKAAAMAAVNDKAKALKYGYCTELMIHNAKRGHEAVRKYLERIDGDSLVVVGDEGIIKIHFHTNDPGRILSYGASVGELFDIKVENMKEQVAREEAAKAAAAEATAAKAAEAAAASHKHCGVIAVAAGEGMAEIFRSLGVDYVISGGQTMNPSAEDILRAIDGVAAREVIILPNNSNIILTAQQVATLSERSVAVVPSKYVTQGLATLLCFNSELSAEENVAAMAEALDSVKNGELTYAIRDSSFNGFEIKEGNTLGLLNGQIVAVGEELQTTADEVIAQMVDEESSLLTLYYGESTSAEDGEALAAHIRAAYPELEVEIYNGGQPLYYYLISVE